MPGVPGRLGGREAPGHFTFRELEARGEDLGKLQGFYRKIHGRDLHGARGRDVTDVNPEASGKALGEFAAKVYASRRRNPAAVKAALRSNVAGHAQLTAR